MWRFHWLFYLLLLVACEDSQTIQTELFEDISVTPRYAKGFEIRSRGSETQIVLRTSSGISGIVTLKGPVERIACLSTTHLAMFITLGEEKRICAMGYAHLIDDSLMQEIIRTNGITNLTTGDDIDAELLTSLQPDVFLTYPFQNTISGRLQGRQMLVLPISEYLESHPLGRAEWILVAGALSGNIEKADSIFRTIERRYLDLVDRAASIRNQVSAKRVLFSSHESGDWFASPGQSTIATLIRDAGMNYLFQDDGRTANVVLNREQLVARSGEIDWWGELIRSPVDPSFSDLENAYPSLRLLNAFRNKQGFYCNTFKSDYFGMAMMQPDVLLADLLAVFHPDEMPEYRPIYFKRMK